MKLETHFVFPSLPKVLPSSLSNRRETHGTTEVRTSEPNLPFLATLASSSRVLFAPRTNDAMRMLLPSAINQPRNVAQEGGAGSGVLDGRGCGAVVDREDAQGQDLDDPILPRPRLLRLLPPFSPSTTRLSFV
jgi:hypothetical protein